MIKSASASMLPQDLLATTASVAASQSLTAVGAELQPAVPTQLPFTLSMLSVMQTGPADESGLEATGATRDGSEEEVGDAEAPVMLLQQILDGLLSANAVPAAPVNAGDSMMTTPARMRDVLSSPASLPGMSLLAQAQTPKLTDVETLPPMQPMTAKNVEITAPLTVLNAGENVTISTLRPAIQPGVAGSETPLASATIKLEPESSRWAQQLQSALGERLQVQVKDQIQHATIRLDPPEMGKIDIAVHIENGRMQVTINASQGEVYRALQQVSNDLRQSLTEQNFVQVNVQVSSQSGQRDGQQGAAQQEQPQDVLVAANIEADANTHREDASVLLTV